MVGCRRAVPLFIYTLAFALQLRKNTDNLSVGLTTRCSNPQKMLQKACSGRSDTRTFPFIILSRFVPSTRPPLPVSYWLPDSSPLPLVLKANICVLFPSAISFTLTMDAARSSETLISYRNSTRSHNLKISIQFIQY